MMHTRAGDASTPSRSVTPSLSNHLLRLQEDIHGSVLIPHDPRYVAARPVHNGAFDAHPALIVQVEGAEDVAAAIRFGRSAGLEIAIRGGGHSPAGFGSIEGGMVIDMGRMKRVDVDAERRVARAQAGVRTGEYLAALAPYDLVSPVGDASTTGLAGMTLGAGHSCIAGKYGMAIDNLQAVELVTAEGELLRASAREDEHPDLFWAVRGGGGNFGVVTMLEFRVHHLPQVLAGLLIFPHARAADVLRTYHHVSATAPDELVTYAIMATPPDQGPIVMIFTCWAGDIRAGAEAVAPFRALGPIVDTVAPVPYSVPGSYADPFAPAGLARIEQWHNVTALSDDLLEGLIALAEPARAQGGALLLKQLNGAAARVAPDATAYAHRTSPYAVISVANYTDAQRQRHAEAWSADVAAFLGPLGSGVYGGGSMHATAEEVYGSNLPRLRQVKQQYDPQNIFHTNYNITPARIEQ